MDIPPEVQQALNKPAFGLTDNDWVIIRNFGVLHGVMSNNANTVQCYYMQVDQRYAQLVFIENNLLVDVNGQLLNVQQTPAPIYAMDRYGSLYHDVGILPNGKSLNHSSILAGNDVLCAGNLAIANGELETINNNSGHYKPSKIHLQQCVERLMAEQITFANSFQVELHVHTLNGKQRHYWADPQRFVNNLAPDHIV